MVNKAALQREIETLPPQYYDEVVDFIGYLRHKSQQAAAQQTRTEDSTAQTSSIEQIRARETECINRYAEELNREMEDILLDQSHDI